MIKRLLDFISASFVRKYKPEFVDDVPDKLMANKVYFIANNGCCWQAVFVCPCGCKKNLHLNLNSEYEPYWKYSIEKGGSVTLSPSVHRIVGCKSHFFLRKGKVVWARTEMI